MKVSSFDDLASGDLGPWGADWRAVSNRRFELESVPNDAVDSSPYVMDTFERSSFGSVGSVEARAVHDGDHIAVNLRWEDDTRDASIEDTAQFVDKAAVAFPLADAASIMTMGSTTAPVNAWYWRADRSRPFDVLARGFGDVRRREPAESGLTADARYDRNRWAVTFHRALSVDGDDYVDLTDGPHGIAVAVWDGSNDERGPLKAYSGEFDRITVEVSG